MNNAEQNARGRLTKERCCKGCDHYTLCQHDPQVRSNCVLRDLGGEEMGMEGRFKKARVTRRLIVNGKIVQEWKT
jgi:hypothetical protein